jgi:cell division protein FtsZ
MSLDSRIVGVGGAGIVILNRIFREQLAGVRCIAVDTFQAQLVQSETRHRILISDNGLGSGGNPTTGENLAQKNIDYMQNALGGADRVFFTGGLGGGTASGALPVIAEVARNLGCRTIGVVSYPLTLEGAERRIIAQRSTESLKAICHQFEVVHCDSVARFAPYQSLRQVFSLTERAVSWKILAHLV